MRSHEHALSLAILLGVTLSCDGIRLPLLALHRTPSRPCAVSCGFEVESVSEKDAEGLGVMNWPGIEKRTENFALESDAETMKMVYVKEGAAVLTDGNETSPVEKGQVVMINDGMVKWSSIADGGIVLLTIETSVDEDNDEATVAEPVEDISLKEGAGLLAAGLIFGAVLVAGVKLAQGM
mmetsp:Transcript_62421/g.103827  ORF Transcript_62421/g.103827 Transcript_62421/m.103827 type:complete len:180 (-) Transcript_62421:124-663(-)